MFLFLRVLLFLHFLLVRQSRVEAASGSRKQKFSAALDAADKFMQQGALPEALEAFKTAHELNPTDVYTIQGVATALSHMGQYTTAAKYFELAGQTNGMPQFYMNAGMTYERGGDWEKAIQAYISCLSLSNQQFKPCHVKIAGIYNHMGHFLEVQRHLQVALQLDPTDFQVYNYLGDVYNNLKQFSLAVDTYKSSLAHAPTPQQRVSALTSIGDTLNNLKKYQDAELYYSEAMSVTTTANIPTPTELLIGKLFNQFQIGYWNKYELVVQKIISDCQRITSQGGKPSPLSPYRGLFIPLSPSLSLSIAQSWAKGFLQNARHQQHNHLDDKRPKLHSPLRVSYISRRFEDYPGTQMMLRLFARHNRSRVTIAAHAHGPDDGSPYRRFIEDNSDTFSDISTFSDEAAAKTINEDNIDILVSYDGMHDFNSVKVLMKQPARIQMTWLGFAATTGFQPKQGIDYFLADVAIIPPDVLGNRFSEKLVYLPDTYQPQDELQGAIDEAHEINALDNGEIDTNNKLSPFSNSALWFTQKRNVRYKILEKYATTLNEQSPEIFDSFWYICFNRVEKITPQIFHDWMSILARTTTVQQFNNTGRSSVLILFSQSPEIDQQLQRNANALGVRGDKRIIFLKRMPKSDYSHTLAVSDVFLDTPYYGAHTTASDALFGTLPVITLPRHTVASRVASSLNKAISQAHMITSSAKEYVDLAVLLFEKSETVLPRIRRIILESLGSTLFNSDRFAHHLERAYETVYELHPTYKHVYFVE